MRPFDADPRHPPGGPSASAGVRSRDRVATVRRSRPAALPNTTPPARAPRRAVRPPSVISLALVDEGRSSERRHDTRQRQGRGPARRPAWWPARPRVPSPCALMASGSLREGRVVGRRTVEGHPDHRGRVPRPGADGLPGGFRRGRSPTRSTCSPAAAAQARSHTQVRGPAGASAGVLRAVPDLLLPSGAPTPGNFCDIADHGRGAAPAHVPTASDRARCRWSPANAGGEMGRAGALRERRS